MYYIYCIHRLFQFTGNLFIFANEERSANWCGNVERSCRDCRGVSAVDIRSQCSDRIMCPNLALKLVELYQSLKNCLSENS